jgi:hypothetical protein
MKSSLSALILIGNAHILQIHFMVHGTHVFM